MASDTIFALASGRLPSAVAIVRLSGPLSRFAFETMTEAVPVPRRMRYVALLDGTFVIDRGMAVFFPGPNSATGEDCTEFHLHGGRTVVARLFETLTRLGCKPAEAGDFTKRAFLNGRLDLAQAEAVADLVAAETEAQRRFALDNLVGSQGRLYAGWRGRLLHARAMIEAELDFADEGDVPGSVAGTVWADMAMLGDEIMRHREGYRRAARLRDGFEVVILGAPNAGKSSLINALAQRDVAIVSEEAGTTRDLLEASLDLQGLKVRLVDTAGLRDAPSSVVEQIGMERARARGAGADLVLLLVDLANPDVSVEAPEGVACLTVGNKRDLSAVPYRIDCDVAISARTGENIDGLLRLLAEKAEEAAGSAGDVLPSRERHVGHLEDASARIGEALQAELPLELRAEALRLAGAALGRITGEIGTEEVLGVIFSSFCIGK
jgi:tRNA modification GTPase